MKATVYRERIQANRLPENIGPVVNFDERALSMKDPYTYADS